MNITGKSIQNFISTFLLISLSLSNMAVSAPLPGKEPAKITPSSAPVQASANSSPVMFVENTGQFDTPDGSVAKFQVSTGNGAIWLEKDALWVSLIEKPAASDPAALTNGTMDLPTSLLKDPSANTQSTPQKGVNIKISYPGSNPNPVLEPFNRLDTHVSYILGNDSTKWRPDVPVWGGVRYKDLYPGIDLEVTGEDGEVVQRLVVKTGGDPAAVRMKVDGADEMALTGEQLSLTTSIGDYNLPLMRVNGLDNANLPTAALDGNQVTTLVAPTPEQNQDAILPSSPSDLLYGTYLGGCLGNKIAVGADGSMYFMGFTRDWEVPTTLGIFNIFPLTNGAVCVGKLNADGSTLDYATLIGGTNFESGYDMALDAAENVYVTGLTNSTDFPTTPGAYDTSINDYGDGFVFELNQAGTALVYSTFLGGSDIDLGQGIAVDSSGAAYVTGETFSANFPSTSGAFDNNGSGVSGYLADAFVVKIDPSGSTLAYSTFLGGTSNDDGYDIAVDASGAAYITGATNSDDFPVTDGAYQKNSNAPFFSDAFVTKLTPDGSALEYSTCLGGKSYEEGEGIALSPTGEAYVTGETKSGDFPTTPGAWVSTIGTNSNYDVFLTKLNSNGSDLVYSATFGGSGDDLPLGIAVNTLGEAVVTGYTISTDFPTSPGAYDSKKGILAYDQFITKLNAGGSALLYSSYLAKNTEFQVGFGFASRFSIALDASGSAYVSGGPGVIQTTPGAFRTSLPAGVGADGFIVKMRLGSDITPPPTTQTPWTVMVYLDGDNNLDSAYQDVFNKLEIGARNPNVNVVVVWDRKGTNNSTYYHVIPDSDMKKLANYTDGVNRWGKGELNMNEPKTLSDFIIWSQTKFPAQHYALINSDHGNGLNGTIEDDSNGRAIMSVKDLGIALSDATSKGANKIDVVFADSCLMGMIEDGYQIRNYANYYVASENMSIVSTLLDVGPFDQYINDISSTTTARALAVIFTNDYANWLDRMIIHLNGYTISAVDLNKIDPLITAISHLSPLLVETVKEYPQKYIDARNDVQKFDSNANDVINNADEYVDLTDLASEIKNNIPEDGIKIVAQSVIDAASAYVVNSRTNWGSYAYTFFELKPWKVHGVSIFFPPGDLTKSFYSQKNLDFASDAIWFPAQPIKASVASDNIGWGSFLVKYVQTIDPNAPDDPNPPALVEPIISPPVIFGNAGVPGVTLSYSDGKIKTVTSDNSGNYYVPVPLGWSGTVTPSKTGYDFSPASKNYTNVQADQSGQDYTASLSAPPVVQSITRADIDPGNAASVNFSVTFSKPVTGVDATDFVVTASGISGAAVTNVSGAGNVYTVTISTGSGSGSLRLDLVDDDSIVDAVGNPLGGVGLGNGNFSSGEIYPFDRPTDFNKTGPTNGAAMQTTGISLSWGASARATEYEICFYNTIDGTCGAWISNGTATTVNLIGLANGSTYRWQVRARNDNGLVYANGANTNFWTFQTPPANKFTSQAALDGWVLESGKNSNIGKNFSTTGTLRVGDSAANRQYRSILSFDTSSLPDNAVIIRATLTLKTAGFAGTNPFTTHGGLLADIQKGFFGSNQALQAVDFQAANTKIASNSFSPVSGVTGVYQLVLQPEDVIAINTTGLTQFRLRFALPNNNDRGDDFISFYAGDSATAALRPALVVEYSLP